MPPLSSAGGFATTRWSLVASAQAPAGTPEARQAACQHFLANEWDRARALRRGGGLAPLPLDFADAEGRYGREGPGHEESPERSFERRWALALLHQVLRRLR